ncbi:MAG: hypothetical protein H5T50_07035 [Nitrososphaeria archaeon]|nr:hypothetical protein [Nitrososphaeria archaeon]
MDNVKKTDKDVYEIINFLARSYQNDVFDTKEISTFLKIYSVKLKLSKKEEKEFEEKVNKFFEKINDLSPYISYNQISRNRHVSRLSQRRTKG